MKTAYLAWEDPHSHAWSPIGRLSATAAGYEFVYTHGARQAAQEGSFRPLEVFPNLNETYYSHELFPVFLNRIPKACRDDYKQYVQWLDFGQDPQDPIALLARSGGQRATDTFEMFPCPEPDEHGQCIIHFFAHGLRYLSPDSLNRILQLKPGETLLLAADLQNRCDIRALALRTNEAFSGDRYLVGYVPRYLASDVHAFMQAPNESLVRVVVERLNPPPAPLQFRLLCRLSAVVSDGFRSFSSEAFQPIAAAPRTTDDKTDLQFRKGQSNVTSPARSELEQAELDRAREPSR